MKQVFVISLLLVCFSSCTSAYREHFVAQHTAIMDDVHFSPISGEQLSILPDKAVKKQIIESIQNAQKRIWIEIYLWTDKDILTNVIDAHRRGVDVRIALEGNVYSLPNANKSIFDALIDAGILVVYTDNYQYTFTHAKFWIIDDTYAISTGNWTKSFFETNRDFIVHGSDQHILDFLVELFLRDVAHESVGGSIPKSIVLSPVASRTKIYSLIQGAHSSIDVFVQTLSDPAILLLLAQKKQAHVAVRVCTANNEESMRIASGSVLDWHLAKKPYLHAKVMVIDGEKIWIGSQNLTTTSLDKNREVGYLFSDSGAFLSQILYPLKKDCQFD